MNTVTEIQAAIGQLAPEHFSQLIGWIKDRFANEWDRQIEDDVTAGKLDHLVRDALGEYHAGQTQPFPPNEKPRDL
ncbi:MAG: hypothetical protein DVB26_07290 [Verrucomicrobia bacterium]|nr:MAG: hypothetical protein DVB26_07290 [Verrucomicrobiota bacterium]